MGTFRRTLMPESRWEKCLEGDLVFDGEQLADYLYDNNSNLMMEPAIKSIAGFEKIKFQLHYGYRLNVSNSDFRQDKSYLIFVVNFNFPEI